MKLYVFVLTILILSTFATNGWPKRTESGNNCMELENVIVYDSEEKYTACFIPNTFTLGFKNQENHSVIKLHDVTGLKDLGTKELEGKEYKAFQITAALDNEKKQFIILNNPAIRLTNFVQLALLKGLLVSLEVDNPPHAEMIIESLTELKFKKIKTGTNEKNYNLKITYLKNFINKITLGDRNKVDSFSIGYYLDYLIREESEDPDIIESKHLFLKDLKITRTNLARLIDEQIKKLKLGEIGFLKNTFKALINKHEDITILDKEKYIENLQVMINTFGEEQS